MKKLFPLLAATAFVLSIAMDGCVKEKSPPPRPQPAKKESAVTAKKAVPKRRAELFTGTIEDLDEAAGTLTLKGPRGERRFQAKKRVMEQLDDLEIGDKVIVKHIDEIALSIVKPRTSKSALVRKEDGVI